MDERRARSGNLDTRLGATLIWVAFLVYGAIVVSGMLGRPVGPREVSDRAVPACLVAIPIAIWIFRFARHAAGMQPLRTAALVPAIVSATAVIWSFVLLETRAISDATVKHDAIDVSHLAPSPPDVATRIASYDDAVVSPAGDFVAVAGRTRDGWAAVIRYHPNGTALTPIFIGSCPASLTLLAFPKSNLASVACPLDDNTLKVTTIDLARGTSIVSQVFEGFGAASSLSATIELCRPENIFDSRPGVEIVDPLTLAVRAQTDLIDVPTVDRDVRGISVDDDVWMLDRPGTGPIEKVPASERLLDGHTFAIPWTDRAIRAADDDLSIVDYQGNRVRRLATTDWGSDQVTFDERHHAIIASGIEHFQAKRVVRYDRHGKKSGDVLVRVPPDESFGQVTPAVVGEAIVFASDRRLFVLDADAAKIVRTLPLPPGSDGSDEILALPDGHHVALMSVYAPKHLFIVPIDRRTRDTNSIDAPFVAGSP